eukprot:scaffold28732_cov15-Tisochrysis_lutea.AAC.1
MAQVIKATRGPPRRYGTSGKHPGPFELWEPASSSLSKVRELSIFGQVWLKASVFRSAALIGEYSNITTPNLVTKGSKSW